MGSREERRRATARETRHMGSGVRRGSRRGSSGLASDATEISTIGVGQGARVTTRDNVAEAADRARHNAELRYAQRHPEERAPKGGPKRSVLNIVLLVVAGVLALGVVFAVGTLVNSVLFPPASQESSPNDQTLRPTESEQEVIDRQDEHDAAQEQVGVDGTVSYSGVTYALRASDDGGWSLVNSAGDVIVALEGTPVALARAADTILIPEERDGGWDVVCYVVGGHSDGTTYVVGEDGTAVSGTGGIASVELDGTTLHVTGDDGAVTDVALV